MNIIYKNIENHYIFNIGKVARIYENKLHMKFNVQTLQNIINGLDKTDIVELCIDSTLMTDESNKTVLNANLKNTMLYNVVDEFNNIKNSGLFAMMKQHNFTDKFLE
jgi:hypothetical protein